MRRLDIPVSPGRAATFRLFACLAAGLALSPEPVCAQYMALTAPPRSVAPAIVPDAHGPVPPPAHTAAPAIDGRLPNQRTGSARHRVVRDICIGCDR